MLFDVKVLYRGEEQTWTYGTNSNAVTDCFGIRRNPKPEGWLDAETLEIENSGVSALSVFLGYNCNLDCKYCYQKEHRDAYKGAVASPSLVSAFIEKLKKQDLHIRRVSFWGGEPLVFWKTIVLLVPELERLYPYVQFSIVTNGVLLTEDKIDFMAEHNFSCNVSCDGYPDERGYDLLLLKGPELRYLMDKLGEETIFQACVSKGREDIRPALVRFRKMIGNDVRVSFAHPIRASSKEDPASELCIEDWKKFRDSLYEVREEFPESRIVTQVGDLKRAIKFRYPTNFNAHFCGPGSGRAIVLDLAGATYSCHAGDMNSTGDLEHYEDRDFSEFIDTGVRKAHCGECPLYVACKAGCPLTSKEGLELSCAGRYGLSFAVFKIAWKELFDVEVIELTPHSKE